MRKKSLILFQFVLLCFYAKAQTDNNAIPKLIPPSPNAAALEKFSAIPVEYSTGIPSISYPMWSWQRGKLQFSLGLSYHAGGHKVDDMASNVGLGWTLAGIGRISRTVRGTADDEILKGFIYAAPLPALATNDYNGNNYYFTSHFTSTQTSFPPGIAITQLNSTYSSLVKQISESEVDAEQDIFSYSINGASGKFVINKSKQVIPLEHTNIKIEMVRNSDTPPYNGYSGRINYFQITDDKGIVYKFEYQEEQTSETITAPAPFPGTPIQTYTSGWLLTKIIDPNTQDSIVVNYTSNTLADCLYETSFSENQQISIGTNGFGTPSNSSSYVVVSAKEPRPTSVSFPDGSSMQFEYNFNRADYVNAKALTKVTVKNYLTAIVKSYQLNYSYFTASSGGIFPASGNDNSKRLKLDGVDEKSTDNTLTKSTTFTYNSTLLNPRGSRNVDFWGYNVNPSRNNLFYAPTVPLSGDELAYGSYLNGANRSSDSTYVKAGVLEKIQYPTGGFVSFNYECNKAYSSINYYVNKYETNTATWQQNSFNQGIILSIPSRVSEGVEFNFHVENDPTATPQSNNPPTCFVGDQEAKILRFEFIGTGGYSTFREYTYQQLTGFGITEVINLPLGQNYRIKLVYNATAPCSFIYAFKALAKGSFYIIPEDKLAGGLRIKSITANDGTSVVSTKAYTYNNPDGHSSAQFTSPTNIPNFGYYRTGLSQGVSPQVLVKIINRPSNPTNTLNFNGAPIIYARVIEKEVDGSSIERQYDPFIRAGNGGDPNEYPYMPIQDFPNLSGLLTKVLVKDNLEVVKKEQTITYNKVQSQLIQGANRNLKTGTIATSSGFSAKYYVVDYYFMFTSRAEVITDETKEYENGQTLTTAISKAYDPTTHYLISEATTNSKSEPRATTYKYTNQGTGSAYTSMLAKNMLNYVIEKTYENTGLGGSQLSRNVTNFQLFQGGALPMAGTIQNSILGQTLQTDIAFESYDDKGNILQYTAKDGVVTSIIWGYNKQYPVARIIGKAYADAISQSGLNLATVNTPGNDNAMRTELNKLRALSGCLVTTLTYRPLVGVTSEMDPNGLTTFYEYDAFNRLTLVRDKDNNILKKICYNYSGQPEICISSP